MNEASSPSRRRSYWPTYAGYLAAFGMVLAFAEVAIQFLGWVSPYLNTDGMLIVCGLVSIEAFASFSLVRLLPTAQRQIAFYRVTEFAIILIATKIFTEARAGSLSFWTNVAHWPVQFPFNILNGPFLLTVLPVLASWQASNLLAKDLHLLGTDESTNLDERVRSTPVRTLILRRFFELGILVALLAGIPPQTLILTTLPVASNAVPAVVAYFVCGLVLVSLTRYINLESSWWQAKLHVPPQLPRRWFFYSGLILVILVTLISLLPTEYDVGLLATFMAIFRIIEGFFALIYGLILLAITMLSQVFSKVVPAPIQLPAATPAPPVHITIPAEPIDWALVKSIFLWGILIILIVIALRQYIFFNQELATELKRFKPLRWIANVWNRLRAGLKKANRSIGDLIQKSYQRLRGSNRDGEKVNEWDFINPRRLPPRQKVIFYYLALVRRAREAGLPRKDGQTPYEFGNYLKSNIREEKEDLDAITDSFIEARYSRHEIKTEKAQQTETIWEVIRHVLRRIH